MSPFHCYGQVLDCVHLGSGCVIRVICEDCQYLSIARLASRVSRFAPASRHSLDEINAARVLIFGRSGYQSIVLPGIPSFLISPRRSAHSLTMITIAGLLLALTLAVQAADQTPDVAYGLTVEHRPDTAWRPCRSTGDDRTNCGFCYGPTGGFLGWNCECDTFVRSPRRVPSA